MKKLAILIFLLGFFLFRPYLLQNATILYSGDDQNYFAHASALAYGKFPGYSQENFVWGGKIPVHSIGPGLMAAPFVWMGSIIDRISGHSVVQIRTEENIRKSWSLFGFVLSSEFYFCLACFLLFGVLQKWFDQRTAITTIFFCILAEGIPLYVFRRPIFSHIYEFFLQSALVSILLQNSFNQKKLSGEFDFQKAFTVGILSGLIFLVRYNNLGFALIWPVILFKKQWKSLLMAFTVEMTLVLLFLVYPWWHHYHGAGEMPPILYGGVGGNMLEVFLGNPAVILERLTLIPRLLFGIDWGLLFTAPFFVLGLWLLLFSKYDSKHEHLLLGFVLLINLWVALSWIPKWQQGNWYGYRFLIFSGIPLIIFPFATFLKNLSNRTKFTKMILWFVWFFPFFSMVLFDGNSTSLTLSENHSANSVYQLNVWQTILFHQKEFLIALLKGGPLYIIYLTSHLFHLDQQLPAIVAEKYLSSGILLFVKSCILYSFPFLFCMFFSKGKRGEGVYISRVKS